jgi:hypothetical protein
MTSESSLDHTVAWCAHNLAEHHSLDFGACILYSLDYLMSSILSTHSNKQQLIRHCYSTVLVVQYSSSRERGLARNPSRREHFLNRFNPYWLKLFKRSASHWRLRYCRAENPTTVVLVSNYGLCEALCFLSDLKTRAGL